MCGATDSPSRSPVPLDAVTGERLRRQRRTATRPERELRHLLHRAGLRYFVDRPVAGVPRVKPDVVFPRLRIAVFVDGCFWHSCPEHGTIPKNNAEWWKTKLAANVDRDRRVSETLSALDWLVMRLWEHESPEAMAQQVMRAVELRRRESCG